MKITQKLYWLMSMGITNFCSEKPKSHSSLKVQPSSVEESAATVAHTHAVSAQTLAALNQEKMSFSHSSLKKTATNTVLGKGPEQPILMCISEFPDAEADKHGDPFAGPQGTLLSKMLGAIHLDPGMTYVTYLSPWRTPGNRPLTTTEKALFLPFLEKEIQLVRPQKILIFGTNVAGALLGITSLSKARGVWHSWQDIPVRVTLPLNMVKATPQRQQAWTDLQAVENKS